MVEPIDRGSIGIGFRHALIRALSVSTVAALICPFLYEALDNPASDSDITGFFGCIALLMLGFAVGGYWAARHSSVTSFSQAGAAVALTYLILAIAYVLQFGIVSQHPEGSLIPGLTMLAPIIVGAGLIGAAFGSQRKKRRVDSSVT
jgi:peptidoglycan/LPS O-acetylase OafA/YrhL